MVRNFVQTPLGQREFKIASFSIICFSTCLLLRSPDRCDLSFNASVYSLLAWSVRHVIRAVSESVDLLVLIPL